MTPARIAVLISGRGTNLQSIIDAIASGQLDGDDRGRHFEPAGRARACSARAMRESRRCASTRATIPDRRRVRRGAGRDPASRATSTLVCLAGFMRLVGDRCSTPFRSESSTSTRRCCRRFRSRSAASGARARRARHRRDGASRDVGARRRSDRPAGRGAGAGRTTRSRRWSARILVEEHRLYPEAIRLVLAGGWVLQGRRFLPAQVP